MMRPIVTLSVLFFVFLTPPAAAQVLVIGDSAASACYRSVTFNRADFTALQDCDTALERDMLGRRDRAATHVNRGILRLRRDQLADAMEDFDRAAELDRRGRIAGPIAVNRSAVLIRTGQFSAAIAQTDLAIESGGPGDHVADAWFNRAVALEELGHVEAAYRAYVQAQALRPDWSAPRRELERFTIEDAS